MNANVQAIVLRTYPLREQDLVVVLYTKELGKIRAAAYGGRKPTSRLNSFCQPFVCGVVQLQTGNYDLAAMRQAEVELGLGAVRTDMTKAAFAAYFAEVFGLLTPERQQDTALFEVLRQYLLRLNASPDQLLKQVQAGFLMQLLAQLGYALQLQSCAICGNELSNRMRFSPEYGGVICRGCAAGITSELKPVPAAVVRELSQFTAYNNQEQQIPVSNLALSLLDRFIFYHVERVPGSYSFYLLMRDQISHPAKEG